MPDPKERFADLGFPFAGISLLRAFSDQRPVQMNNQDWGKTCRAGKNVRGFDVLGQRLRGGSRPGLSKYIPQAVGNIPNWIVQLLNTITGTTGQGTINGMTNQLNQSGRIVYLIAVSQGTVFVTSAGNTVWFTTTNNTGSTPPLVFTGEVRSTSLNQQLWFADGSNYVGYNPANNTVFRWGATAGSLPRGSDNGTPRLICTWRGRIVLSGLVTDPQNWFMSKVFVPTDFDYTGFVTVPDSGGNMVAGLSPDRAVAGNNSPAGMVGDVITSLVPYSDDVLIFGGDHTIYQASGDPANGGTIDRISDNIGFAWGDPWCRGPDGTLYFFSNKMGIYSMVPGQQKPMRMSQQIEQLVNNLDTGQNTIKMLWNDRAQGFHVFITPTLQPGVTTHLFWEARTGAWWQDQFANNNLNPIAATVYDGNLPTDRVTLIGSWDGFVRGIDPSATTDDGSAISSSVLIGPLLTADLDEMLLKDLQAVLGETSGTVNYDVFIGASAEAALSNPSVASGTWTSGRNLSNLIRRAGHAVYVQLSSSNQWAIEAIRARVATQGKVRRRGA